MAPQAVSVREDLLDSAQDWVLEVHQRTGFQITALVFLDHALIPKRRHSRHERCSSMGEQ